MQIQEGGNVFKDADGRELTQRINQTDVATTVQWLEQLTGLDLTTERDANNVPMRWLGSTGRKPTSGDLDLAVDPKDMTKEQLVAKLSQWAQSHGEDPKNWVRKSGISVHFKTPINGNPKLGFVQTDFMFLPKMGWSSWVMSADPGSEYKGVHRNVLMNSVAKALGLKLNQNEGLFRRVDNAFIADDPDQVAKILLNKQATKDDLRSVEAIYSALAKDPQREAKLADFTDYLAREGLTAPNQVQENDVGFLARLRDRIVNQGMQPLVEHEVITEAEVAGVGGRAKGIEHLEDLVFRHGTRGVEQALGIVQHVADAPGKTVTVKWDGKPALVFGRKPATGEFVLTDGSGFEAKGYDGLATSPKMMAQIQSMRSGDRTELIQLYATLFPVLEAATPANFRGYVKGDLLYMSTPPLEAGNYVFKPNTVEYRIPAKTSLGKRIGASEIGVAMHSMYADVGEPRQPLSRVKFNDVPGLLLIEPIAGKEIAPNAKLVQKIKQTLRANGRAIDTLFNPSELRAQQITDLAKLCVDYINARIPTGNFDNLIGGFVEWLETKVTPRKFNNIVEYLQSPRSNTQGMAAAFTLFLLLHDLKLDILQQLDVRDPGHEGWVMATPAGYAKAVNRFDFTARNRAQNNPQRA